MHRLHGTWKIGSIFKILEFRTQNERLMTISCFEFIFCEHHESFARIEKMSRIQLSFKSKK